MSPCGKKKAPVPTYGYCSLGNCVQSVFLRLYFKKTTVVLQPRSKVLRMTQILIFKGSAASVCFDDNLAECTEEWSDKFNLIKSPFLPWKWTYKSILLHLSPIKIVSIDLSVILTGERFNEGKTASISSFHLKMAFTPPEMQAMY